MHLVPAGQTVAFIDFSDGVFWLKSTNANNIPQYMRKFKFEEIVQSPQIPQGDFVSKSDFEELKALVIALGGKLNESNSAVSDIPAKLSEAEERPSKRGAGIAK